MIHPILSPHFPLGQICLTVAAEAQVARADLIQGLRRHTFCDWGEVSPLDRDMNTRALQDGGLLLSSYRTAQGIRFWVVTDANRESTTVLMAEDY